MFVVYISEVYTLKKLMDMRWLEYNYRLMQNCNDFG